MTPAQVARRYYELFNDRQLDESGDLVSPFASFHYVPTRQHLAGRAGYRALAAAWLIACEDASADVQSIEDVNDHTVIVTFIGRGTHTGDLEFGEGLTLRATGRRAQLVFRDTLEVRDGLIMRSELDFDLEELRRQLSADRTRAFSAARRPRDKAAET